MISSSLTFKKHGTPSGHLFKVEVKKEHFVSELEGLLRLNAALGKKVHMISMGLVLLLVGFLAGIVILKTLGVLLVVVGVVLVILGGLGMAVGGRRHYW